MLKTLSNLGNSIGQNVHLDKYNLKVHPFVNKLLIAVRPFKIDIDIEENEAVFVIISVTIVGSTQVAVSVVCALETG